MSSDGDAPPYGKPGTVELRLDWLSSDARRARFLDCSKGNLGMRPISRDLPPREGGGKFAGLLTATLLVIQAREALPMVRSRSGKPCASFPASPFREYPCAGVFLSVHDFERTRICPKSEPPVPRRGRCRKDAGRGADHPTDKRPAPAPGRGIRKFFCRSRSGEAACPRESSPCAKVAPWLTRPCRGHRPRPGFHWTR